MTAVETLTVKTSEIDIAYREYGDPQGTPWLMLHGFPDAPSTFDGVIEKLDAAKRGLRLIVPWSRGYGATQVNKPDLLSGEEAALTQDVFVLADRLGLQKFGIVGHDWGARAGFAACVLQPERVTAHFALASPYEMFGGEMPPEQADAYWYQWYFQTAQGKKALETEANELCHHIWERWSPTWSFGKREFAEAAAAWENPQFAGLVLSSYRHRWGNTLGKTAYAETQAKLDSKPKSKIATPTWFVYGSEDHCVLPAASEGQAKYFTGEYKRLPIKGVGHFPQREDAAAVTKLFLKFLESLR